ncbi:MAG TPA: hypothetical protein VFY44_06785 [Thermoleophilaceae bacterium]|nr:hypothetical protein [Thermoleophilaceae bacterium]
MKSFTLALSAALLLAAAPAASAATYKFGADLERADFRDGKAGKATFKVKTNKKGVASKVTSVKLSGLKSLCLSEDGVKPGATVSGTLGGSISIKKPTSSFNKYSFQKSGLKLGGFAFSVSGTVNKAGTKVMSFRIDGGDTNPQPPSCTARGDGKPKKK